MADACPISNKTFPFCYHRNAAHASEANAGSAENVALSVKDAIGRENGGIAPNATESGSEKVRAEAVASDTKCSLSTLLFHK